MGDVLRECALHPNYCIDTYVSCGDDEASMKTK